MGTRGPAPTPNAILGAGSHHAKYRRGPDAGYVPKAPTCPKWLSPEAKREFRRMARLMGQARTITELDQAILACYAETVAHCERLALRVQALDLQAQPREYLQELKAWMQTADLVLRIAMQLGATPASRTRVHPLPEPTAGVPSRVAYRQRD